MVSLHFSQRFLFLSVHIIVQLFIFDQNCKVFITWRTYKVHLLLNTLFWVDLRWNFLSQILRFDRQPSLFKNLKSVYSFGWIIWYSRIVLRLLLRLEVKEGSVESLTARCLILEILFSSQKVIEKQRVVYSRFCRTFCLWFSTISTLLLERSGLYIINYLVSLIWMNILRHSFLKIDKILYSSPIGNSLLRMKHICGTVGN